MGDRRGSARWPHDVAAGMVDDPSRRASTPNKPGTPKVDFVEQVGELSSIRGGSQREWGRRGNIQLKRKQSSDSGLIARPTLPEVIRIRGRKPSTHGSLMEMQSGSMKTSMRTLTRQTSLKKRDQLSGRTNEEHSAFRLAKERAKKIERRIRVLKRVKLFQSLTPEQLTHAAGVLEEVSYLPGTDVVKQGEHGNDFFIILKGRVDVLHVNQVRSHLPPCLLVDPPNAQLQPRARVRRGARVRRYRRVRTNGYSSRSTRTNGSVISHW